MQQTAAHLYPIKWITNNKGIVLYSKNCNFIKKNLPIIVLDFSRYTNNEGAQNTGN